MTANLLSCFKLCGGGDDDGRYKRTITYTADITIDHGPAFFACGRSPSFQIYSNSTDTATSKGKVSKEAYLVDKFGRKEGNNDETRIYQAAFEVDETGFGKPGALAVQNMHHRRFLLRCVTINSRGVFKIFFNCKSWIYPFNKTDRQPRVFFSNVSYLPSVTPRGLKVLREEELKQLRGEVQLADGRQRQEWERIYNYETYNDLGNIAKSRDLARPTLGGNTHHPYPRRLFSGRYRAYVPPDERFSPHKMSEVSQNLCKAVWRFLVGAKSDDSTISFKRMDELFEVFEDKVEYKARRGGLFSLMKNTMLELFMETTKDQQQRHLDPQMKEKLQLLALPDQFYQQVLQQRTKPLLDVPLPSIIAENTWGFAEDDEFGRQMLAGINPTRIQCLTTELCNKLKLFSPDEKGSGIRKSNINNIMSEFCWVFRLENVDEAIEGKMMFILDHHDYLLPYLRSINKWEVRAYASRTLLLVTKFGTLVPMAIELTAPTSSYSSAEIQGELASNRRTFYNPNFNLHDEPEGDGTVVDHKAQLRQGLWSLAKLHVAANDTVYHLLVTHWLHTHAVVEPFIIAARRQLSTMHPLHRLLDPHFKDTLHANALARALVINAKGVLETLCFTKEVSMEISSMLYKDWKFQDQALPKDLIKRGMAEPGRKDSGEEVKVILTEDLSQKLDIPELEDDDNVLLVLKDYPYAEDGLEIWSVIKRWVRSYCFVFYTDDEAVREDQELQAWWKEIREHGHPEKKDDQNCWYEINTRDDLVKAITTLIWICSAMHAAVNYGQYAYGAFPPNRPTVLHKHIPEEESEEYKQDLEESFEEYFCGTLPDRFEMGMVAALTYVLSQHPRGQLYLGQRDTPDWTDNDIVKLKFDEFQQNLKIIEKRILERNRQSEKYNRWGVGAKIPYKLLYPDTSRVDPNASGITWRGIPNSISI